MTYLNEAAGILSLTLLALVITGLWPQMRSPRSHTASLFAVAILLLGAVLGIRIIYYDIWRTVALAMGWMDYRPLPMSAQFFNAVSNAWLALSAYIALRAMQSSIPEHERENWPWYRAPYYPGGCPLIFWRNRL